MGNINERSKLDGDCGDLEIIDFILGEGGGGSRDCNLVNCFRIGEFLKCCFWIWIRNIS